jgi:hypothetical protein
MYASRIESAMVLVIRSHCGPFTEEGGCIMSIHPEISHLDREERIRAIAYAIWEEEGRPEDCAEAHWLRACDLVEAEATDSEAVDPDWLKRSETPEAEAASATETPSPLSEAIKRMKSSRAA